MPKPLNPSTGLRAAGHYVQPFAFDYGKAPIAQLAGAYNDLGAMADAWAAKKEAMKNDQRLTPLGRNDALRDFIRAAGVEALKKASDALGIAADASQDILSKMVPKGHDKTDVAAAMVRSETRAWLKTLDVSAKVALLMSPDVDPVVVQAIAEAPAHLSGVTQQEKDTIRQREVEASHPDKSKEMQGIEDASQVLRGAVRAAVALLGENNRVEPQELDSLVGGRKKISLIAHEGNAMALAAE